MKIHGIVVAKNEGDIMGYSLEEKLSWCDAVYVYDNGSTDETWEIAREWAAREPGRVFLFRKDNKAFGDGLRAEVFNAYRSQAKRGDWWCRADVDEFYAVNPREFLAKVPGRHHVVWAAHIQYLFTEVDAARCDAAGGACRIPEDLPRYYVANYSEPRFFRYRPGLVWRDTDAWPVHMGVVTPKRIPVRHYQFRSPEQIDRRLATRREAAARGYAHFAHSQVGTWREKIERSAELHLDDGSGAIIYDEGAMPRHLERPMQRWVKLVAHGMGVWA